MRIVTVRDLRDHATEMFRSEDVILVTREGTPAGFFVPWDTPELPVEVRKEVFLRLSEQVGAQLAASGVRESERCWTLSQPPVVVADANVVLSALIGGRPRLVMPPLKDQPVSLPTCRRLPTRSPAIFLASPRSAGSIRRFYSRPCSSCRSSGSPWRAMAICARRLTAHRCS
jgi:hypothetical protein